MEHVKTMPEVGMDTRLTIYCDTPESTVRVLETLHIMNHNVKDVERVEEGHYATVSVYVGDKETSERLARHLDTMD